MDWIPLENALICYFIIALCYFRIVQIINKAWILWISISGYMLFRAIYSEEDGAWYRFINFTILAFTLEAVPISFPG